MIRGPTLLKEYLAIIFSHSKPVTGSAGHMPDSGAHFPVSVLKPLADDDGFSLSLSEKGTLPLHSPVSFIILLLEYAKKAVLST